MPLFGAHMSIAGGFHKAVEAAAALHMDTVQIFTGSPQIWSVTPLTRAKARTEWQAKSIDVLDCQRFIDSCRSHSMRFPIAHSSYLINLAAPNPDLWEKSIAAFVGELNRATQLGLDYVVLHPGSHTTSTPEEGLTNIVRALDKVHARTPSHGAQCLLETTAGQGSCLGWRFEELRAILDGVQDADRLGICFDTCHVFAAGYPLAPRRDYERTMNDFDRIVGLPRIRAFHLNDSKRELGTRVDRHDHIGQGQLGIEPFQLLVNDPRFANVPMYLETPKGQRTGEELDAINLATLRQLVGRRTAKR